MRKLGLLFVAVFEILCAVAGMTMVLGGYLGLYAYDLEPILWYGAFPMLSLIAGVMLLLRAKYSFAISLLVLVLQIPFIVISGVSLLRVALALNLYLTAHWNGHGGNGPTILGLNIMAIGALILLLWARRDLDPAAAVPDHKGELPPPPSFEAHGN